MRKRIASLPRTSPLGVPGRFLRGAFRILATEWKPLLAGAVVALLARAYVVDIYGVRKHSMEPTLHAEEGAADRVAVFKLAWVLGKPKRWDLCVYQRQGQANNPGLQGPLHNVVKRVIGLPGEYVRIGREGDVYVGATPGNLRILRKTPDQLAGLLVPIAELDPARPSEIGGGSWEYDRSRWRVEDKALLYSPGSTEGLSYLTYAEIPHRGYIEPDGEVRFSGQAVRDFGLELTCRPLAPGTRLRLCLTTWRRDFQLVIGDGKAQVRHQGKGVLEWDLPANWVGRSHELRLVQADRRLFGWVDGVARHHDLGPWPEMPAGLKVTSRRYRIALGVAGGDLALERLRVVRDLHFNGANGTHGTGGVPEALGEEEYFMLGDNSGVSEDSRHYGAVPASWLIGRPLMVVLPFTRCKWL